MADEDVLEQARAAGLTIATAYQGWETHSSAPTNNAPKLRSTTDGSRQRMHNARYEAQGALLVSRRYARLSRPARSAIRRYVL